jgi:Mrp family chromosome partitioning ATPase/capsular polysaccharide biosynthesis protein
VLVSIVVCTAAALAYAKLVSPSYQSSALVQLNVPNTTTQGNNPVTLAAPLDTFNSTAVQDQAAKALGATDPAAVASKVTASEATTGTTLTITASGTSPQDAQRIAQAYSTAFVNEVAAQVKTQSDKITAQITNLQTQINEISASGSTTNPAIQANITSLTTSLQGLQTQLTSIELGSPYAQVQIAAAPGVPQGLTTKRLVMIGAVTGLLVGCGAALVRDEFDNRLRASPELESLTDAPVLGTLPRDAEVDAGKVTVSLVQSPQSQMAEAIRELRTSLRVALGDVAGAVVMVTSPEAGDGKTFVTANLGAALAMSGSKVVVVSADFRRPRLESAFGFSVGSGPGLAEVIRANWKDPELDDGPRPRSGRTARAGEGASRAGRATRATRVAPDAGADEGAEESRPARPVAHGSVRGGTREAEHTEVSGLLVETGIWGLDLLPAGLALADIVLIDTPPVLAAPDSAILGRHATGTVVVAAEGKTSRDHLERAINRLEATHNEVLGMVLNRVRRSTSHSYYAYSYTDTAADRD